MRRDDVLVKLDGFAMIQINVELRKVLAKKPVGNVINGNWVHIISISLMNHAECTCT